MEKTASLDPLLKIKTSRSLLWVGIVSIIMLFAAFTSAYIVRKNTGNWLYFELPSSFYTSTILIVLSSFSMIWALRSAKFNRLQHVKNALFITLILGVLFVVFQFNAYNDLVKMGIYAAGKESNASGSFLYLISFLHLLHLGGGIISLIVTLVRALQNKYTSENYNGIYLCSTYWHFLTILWIYLLLFLIYIR